MFSFVYYDYIVQSASHFKMSISIHFHFHSNKCFQSFYSVHYGLIIKMLIVSACTSKSDNVSNISSLSMVFIICYRRSVFHTLAHRLLSLPYQKRNVIRFNIFELRKICSNIVAFFDVIVVFSVHKYSMTQVITNCVFFNSIPYGIFIALSRVMQFLP